MTRSIRSLANLLPIIGALLLILLLPGCSAIKLGYNNAPSLAYWWLDSYADFNEAQSGKLREGLTALHGWHRKSELPAYAGTLRKLQHLAPGTVSPEQVCALFSEVRSSLQRVGQQSERTLSAITPTLKPEQLQHLALKFDKRNQKWREDWIDGTPPERSARRLKLAVDRAETLYGRLEDAQLAVLRHSIATSSFDARLSYREALRRQQDILQTLREHATGTPRATHIRAEVLGLLERSFHSPDPVYRQHFEKMTAESCGTLAALHNSTTAAQRLKALETLKEYETDALALASEKN